MLIMIYVYIFAVSMILTLLFISLFKKLSMNYKKLISAKGVPLIGGVSIGLSIIVTFLMAFSLYGNITRQIWGFILVSIFMLITGIYDDLKEISVFKKFLFQILAVSMLLIFDVRTHIVGMGDLINILITYLWIIGLTNAFNHLDILDGLCAGIGFLISFSFLTVSILNKQSVASIINLIIMGSLLGFLFYNLPPARIYLGNCGSHLLGFILATQAIIINYAPLERKIALLTPIIILGFPIYDTAFLIFMRLLHKKSIFKKSKDHLALRLLNHGYSAKKIIIYLYFISFIFCLTGILVSQLDNITGSVLITILIFYCLALTSRFLKFSDA